MPQRLWGKYPVSELYCLNAWQCIFHVPAPFVGVSVWPTKKSRTPNKGHLHYRAIPKDFAFTTLGESVHTIADGQKVAAGSLFHSFLNRAFNTKAKRPVDRHLALQRAAGWSIYYTQTQSLVRFRAKLSRATPGRCVLSFFVCFRSSTSWFCAFYRAFNSTLTY